MKTGRTKSYPLSKFYQNGGKLDPEDPTKSKFLPSIGHKPGQEYDTDVHIMDKFKKYLRLNTLSDDNYFESKQFKDKKYPFHKNSRYGDFKVSKGEDDQGKYHSLFNYSTFGNSFYDRVYDDEVKRYKGDQKQLHELSSSGAIKQFKDGWALNKTSLLKDIGQKEKANLKDWMNSKGAKERFLKSGTSEQWEEFNTKTNKKLDSLEIKDSPDGVKSLYVSGYGEYSPFQHRAVITGGDSGTITHEAIHGTRASYDPIMNKIIKETVKEHGKGKDSYYQDPGEVYARIQSERADHDIESDHVVTMEEVKKMRRQSYDQIWKYMSDEGMLKLFNSLASNQSHQKNKFSTLV